MVLVVILLAASSGLIFILDYGKKVCIISQNNVIMEEVELTENLHKEIKVSADFENIVEFDGERVRIRSSNCQNQFCVNTGWISKSGQAIVCLPNHVAVKISSKGSATKNQEEVDVVAN